MSGDLTYMGETATANFLDMKQRVRELEAELNDIKIARDQAVGAITRMGHSPHCACRLAWGDGECECGHMDAAQARVKELEEVMDELHGYYGPDHTSPMTARIRELEAQVQRLTVVLTSFRNEAKAFLSVHKDPGYTNLKAFALRIDEASIALESVRPAKDGGEG